MNIRLYKEEDYPQISIWWAIHGEPIPPKELIPSSTYILENEEGKAWVCLSLFTTNTKYLAWSGGLVSNPDITGNRKQAVKTLWDYVANEAKTLGYKNLLCIAPNQSLEKRYSDLGFKTTSKNQTFMMKELGE